MSTPRLSVLVPSLTKRGQFLSRLLDQLSTQNADCLKQTEILVSIDNGVKSVGQKRNELMQAATGEYVVYADDDDEVMLGYMFLIFHGIKEGADHIGITMSFKRDGANEEIIKHSIGHVWENKDGIILRSATHLCPIKREIALQVKFPDKSFGEDKEWAELINPLLRSEYLVEEVIYYYNYRSNKNGI